MPDWLMELVLETSDYLAELHIFGVEGYRSGHNGAVLKTKAHQADGLGTKSVK